MLMNTYLEVCILDPTKVLLKVFAEMENINPDIGGRNGPGSSIFTNIGSHPSILNFINYSIIFFYQLNIPLFMSHIASWFVGLAA